LKVYWGSFEKKKGLLAFRSQAVDLRYEASAPIFTQAIACNFSKGPLTFDQYIVFMTKETIIAGLEWMRLDSDTNVDRFSMPRRLGWVEKR
tara:strand:+ start:345 stop:617 length:273 start_codon:yes stop_codon:yes gene_type:complete